MRNILLPLFMLLMCFNTTIVAQTSQTVSVQLSASVQASPAKISLEWPLDNTASAYTIFRKDKSTTGWGSSIGTEPGTSTGYEDNSAVVGENYEYKVTRVATIGTNHGYINSGIEVPSDQLENRGWVFLAVEKEIYDSLAIEVDQVKEELILDGWQVMMKVYSDTVIDVDVKSDIQSHYITHPNTEAVYLLGDIWVPYSGNINPDAHTNHRGAWAADPYYADMDGGWTDVSVNNVTGSRTETHNIPGDGKWDQSNIPSPVELQVGRVFLGRMTSFSDSEIQLTKNYLKRASDLKNGVWKPIKRAVVDDNFGYFGGEAFGQNAWKNLTPMVGPDSIKSKLHDGVDFLLETRAKSYEWAYGCGGGSYTSCSGIGTTAAFATAPINVAFTMLFGSYFGDWDATNDVMRATLAAGALSSAWAGRPNWFFHHMAMGEGLGYVVKLTMNNSTGIYDPIGYGTRQSHIGLMGDPSLRLNYFSPPSSLMVLDNFGSADLSWTASTESTVTGYHVYRAVHEDSAYVRVTTAPVSGTSYTDTTALLGKDNLYMVRATRLEVTKSGSYHNLSLGTLGEGYISSVPGLLKPTAHLTVQPNPSVKQVEVVIKGDWSGEAKISIYSSHGALVKEIDAVEKSQKIDVSQLAEGLYIVRLESGKEILAQSKLIKTK